jgi:hypothetical protein
LTAIRKYKHFIAVVLLALYVFITTPINFWHHHNNTVNKNASLGPEDKEKINKSKSSGESIKEDCQICSHHYSIYNDDVAPEFIVFNVAFSTKNVYYILSIPLYPHFNSTNKGPPTVA